MIQLAVAGSGLAQGIFTVEVGPPGPGPVSVVAHGDMWRFHKGTNAPAAGWQTLEESALDETWGSGPGGFGYADNTPEVALVQTALSDMPNRYTTFYIRRTFEMTNAVDPEQMVELEMDWDDGFVAWLDGVELPARKNAPGAVGTEPDYTATASGSHESSRGNSSPQPAMTFSLGRAGDLLGAGRHVLAIMGLNQASDSSDFMLLPDLVVAPRASGVVNGTLLSIVQSNSIVLWGTNTLPGAVSVLVNGGPAAYDSGTGEWSATVSLRPGLNRFWLQVLDGGGDQLLATNQDIVSGVASTSIGGVLGMHTSLSAEMGILLVTNSVVVPAGGELSIGPGCVFLMAPGANILATNATISAAGTESDPICFLPADGTTVWGGLIASGVNGRVAAKHIEMAAGHAELFDGAEGDFEDSYFHDYTASSPAIIHTLGQPNHCSITLRRCHVNRYYEILCQVSTNVFEDCLAENQAAGGDGIDFDAGQPGSVIRRCTVRHGRFTNIDALDMGEFWTGESSHGVLIDSCLLYDFADKGVSMGVQVDVTVTNCLIRDVDAAIAVKDLSIAGIYGCTFAGNHYGFHCYNKANPASSSGGGFITNSFNNILWDNTVSFQLLNGSTLDATYSDFQGSNVAGAGNLSVDPLWLDAAGLDFRPGPGSPVQGAGRDGVDMGAVFPVGAAMAASHPVFTSAEIEGTNMVLRFWADSEKSCSIIAAESLSAGNWSKVADFFSAPLPRDIVLTNAISPGSSRFYRIVTPRQP